MMTLVGLSTAIFRPELTKSLHKSDIPANELGQWTSGQIGERIDSRWVVIWSVSNLRGWKCQTQI